MTARGLAAKPQAPRNRSNNGEYDLKLFLFSLVGGDDIPSYHLVHHKGVHPSGFQIHKDRDVVGQLYNLGHLLKDGVFLEGRKGGGTLLQANFFAGKVSHGFDIGIAGHDDDLAVGHIGLGEEHGG